MSISCPNCSQELPDGARFCSECGTTVFVEEKKKEYCAHCFAELSENAKFCLRCGEPALAAKATFSFPENDETLYEELISTSPVQEGYRSFNVARDAWKESGEEYSRPNLSDFDKIQDFEQNKGIIAVRAHDWVKYKISGKVRADLFQDLLIHEIKQAVEEAWSSESHWFRTNKPNHHKALFYETFIDWYLTELRSEHVLTRDNPPIPMPDILDYLRKVRGYEEQEVEEFLQEFDLELPDLDEIRSWAAKDDELFPPPQPVRAEVAGAIVNFTTDEAVLVVYMDCIHKGQKVEAGNQKVPILERTVGNISVCAAIFSPFPFATDEMKNNETVKSQKRVEVDALKSCHEEVLLFKGNVAELDWRGRSG